MRRTKSGFTLIELLIVVAIIAILAAIAVPNFLEAQTRSRVSHLMANMKTVGNAIIAYTVDNNQPIPCAYYTHYFSEFYPDLSYPGSYWYIWLEPTHDGAGKFLTSPISYLTTIPEDIFHHADIDEGSSFNWLYVGPVPLPGRTTSGVSIGEWWGGGRVWRNYPQYAFRQTRWAIYSYGPDRQNWGLTKSRETIYDPTNGTISEGDIWFFETLGFVGGSR